MSMSFGQLTIQSAESTIFRFKTREQHRCLASATLFTERERVCKRKIFLRSAKENSNLMTLTVCLGFFMSKYD